MIGSYDSEADSHVGTDCFPLSNFYLSQWPAVYGCIWNISLCSVLLMVTFQGTFPNAQCSVEDPLASEEGITVSRTDPWSLLSNFYLVIVAMK